MSKNSVVSLTLQVKGQQASQELKRIATDQITAIQKINTEQQKTAAIQAGQVGVAKKVTDEQRKQGQALTTQKREALALDTARKLGIRTEQQINAEIKKTQGAYTQLSILQRQGLVTAKDMERAYASMKSRVTTLNTELGKTVSTEKQIQQIQKTGGSGGMSTLQRGSIVAGATVAGGAVLSNALQKPRDYAQLMTYITATATGGQGLTAEQRLAKTANFEGFVKNAVRGGGGKREDVAAALNELIASGKYDESNVSAALSSSSKTAFAAGADTVDAAKMTIAMQNFGVKNIDLAQDRAMRAGQIGSFEYKDLSKFLPSQMAMARAAGYSGDDGYIKLLALNQVAKSTAGDSAEAGNNVTNLLQKLSSRELSDTLADKIENTDGLPTRAVKNKKGKVVGQEFDWATYSVQQREQGVYGVEAFVKLLEHQLQNNDQYKKLQKEANAAKTPEDRKAKLEDMSNIAMGSELGQFLADRQALLAAMAAVYNKEQTVSLEKNITSAQGTRDADLEMIRQTEWAKDQAADQEKLFAQSKAYDSVSETLGKVKENITDWAQKHEELAASAYKASVALGMVTAIGVVGTILNRGKDLPDLPTGTKTKGAPKVKGSSGLKAAGFAGLAYAGYELFEPLDDYIYGALDKARGGSGERPDFVQQAIDKSIEAQSQQTADLIAKQEQANKLSQDMIGKLNSLINVTQQNKPIPFSAGNLLESVSGQAKTESSRTGAFIPHRINN
ncbi:phage tail tape measure protein [Acinetobacter johnsonii]|uniref:phage tail tape measure protein n=1 Tax=Acinetobacter johnsonii TaxID=40214 RepID=UPI00103A7B08|nr:phage tail tape measure protein [Acinetobacter johnsonii]QBK70671.1 phage tail tape measure protein [Acinetobacter johnsonii]